MTITFRGGSGTDEVEFTNQNARNLTYPSGVVAGDYAQIGISWYNDQGTKPTSTGYTEIATITLSSGNFLTVLERTFTGSVSGTFAVNMTGATSGYGNASLMVFAGSSLTRDGTYSSQVNASSTSCTGPGITTSAANEMLIGWFGANDATTVTAGSSGMTLGTDGQNSASNSENGFYQAIASAGATGTRTVTLGTARENGAIMTAIKEGGSAAALAGAPAAVATATGAITTKVAASGASLSVSTASGTISTAISLAGPVSVISTPAAAATTKIAGAGLSAAVSTPSASLTAVVDVAGGSLAQTVVSAALSTILRVIGNSSASVTAAGQLTAQVNLAGLSPAEAKAWATLSAYGPAAADGQIAADLQTTGVTTETDGYLGAVFPVVVAGDAAVSATATGALINWSSFTLGWSAVAGATGYRIKVGTSSGVYDPARQVDVGPTILTYAIGGLFPGVTYYFTIVALDSEGHEGVAAPEISGIGDPPGAPHVLTGAIISAAVATAAMNTKIALAGTVQALVAVAGALGNIGAVLAGNPSATTTAIAGLQTVIAASGAVLDITTVTGALGASIAALQGLSAAQSIVGGQLSVIITMSGGSAAQAVMSGTLSGTPAALSGAALASALASGSLTTIIPVSGAALVNAVISGSLEFGIHLDGIVSATAMASGSIDTEISMSGQANAVTILTGRIIYTVHGKRKNHHVICRDRRRPGDYRRERATGW